MIKAIVRVYSVAWQTKGVTLIELVVVLAIVTFLAALAAIGPGFISTEKVRNTSKELLADLQLIRHYAMMQGPDVAASDLRGYGIRFESKNRYRLFRFNDSNQNFFYDGAAEESPLTSGETAVRQRDIPAPLDLKVKSGEALADIKNAIVIFDHLGMPRQANLGVQQMSIVIQHPDMGEVAKQCITVSYNRIREGAWNGSTCQQQ
jgi:prepilin-type N-terminal cleavage/methylation domain-containing protein